MNLTNKQVIEKLKIYFNTVSQEKLAHLCAGYATDLNRFLHFELLDKEEQVNLVERTQRNMETTLEFIYGNCTDDLNIVVTGSPKEDEN